MYTKEQIVTEITFRLNYIQKQYEEILQSLLKSEDPSSTLKWNGSLISFAANISVFKRYLKLITNLEKQNLSEEEILKEFKYEILRNLTKSEDLMSRSTSVMHNLVEDFEKNALNEILKLANIRFYK